MKIKIKELKNGYSFKYNNINDVQITFEEKPDGVYRVYVFSQSYDNFNPHTGEGGGREKITSILSKETVENPKDRALRLLQDVLIEEVLPKDVSLEFIIIKKP